MFKSIKGKLLAGFAGVITVAVISGSVSLFQIKEISRTTDRFVDELWSTADLIMETNIALQEDVRTVLAPDDRLDRQAFALGFHQRLAEIRVEFETAALSQESVSHIYDDLDNP